MKSIGNRKQNTAVVFNLKTVIDISLDNKSSKLMFYE